jgi:hypothetical protein
LSTTNTAATLSPGENDCGNHVDGDGMARPFRTDVIIHEMPPTLHAPCSRRDGDCDAWATQRDLDVAASVSTWAAVDEKVDGAQLAVKYVDGAPHLRQRSHVMSKAFVAKTPHQRQLAPAWAWFHERSKRFERLAAYLGYEPTVHGEWLLGRHGVGYDALPAPWLAFDIMDEHGKLFIPHGAAHDALRYAGIDAVPVLASGAPADVIPRLEALSRGPTLLSRAGCPREGAYLRLGDRCSTIARFKVIPGGVQRGLTIAADGKTFERNGIVGRT